MSEAEDRLDKLFDEAFSANHPAMLDYVKLKFETKAKDATIAALQKENVKLLKYKQDSEAVAHRLTSEIDALRARLEQAEKGLAEERGKIKRVHELANDPLERWLLVRAEIINLTGEGR